MSAVTTTHHADPIGAIALLDEPTRRRLYEAVAGSSAPLGRDEAAAIVGISRELAAFHLDRLVRAGMLEAEYRRLGGRRGPGAGRPSKLYRPTGRDIAVSFPARDYERVADLLAEALEELPGEAAKAAVSDVAHARGHDVGAQARRGAGSRPSGRRLEAVLVELLRDAGYEPESDPDERHLRLRNCPFRTLAADHRDLTCGLNLAWARGVVDGLEDRRLSAELAPEPGRCCVVFRRTQ